MNDNAVLREHVIAACRPLIYSRDHTEISLDELANYAGVSVDEISPLAKRKEDIFALIVRAHTQEVNRAIFSVSPEGKTDREFLLEYAQNYLRLICRPEAVKGFQFAAGLARAYPHISAQFRATAREGGEAFAKLLENMTNITVPEGMTFMDASSQFHALCRGAFHHQLIFDIEYIVSEQEITAQAQKAVTTFLSAFPSADFHNEVPQRN